MPHSAHRASHPPWSHASPVEAAFTRGALDHVPEAVVLVTSGGVVTFANRAALLLLAEKDGIRMHTHQGQPRLELTDKENQRTYASLAESFTGSRHFPRASAGLRVGRLSGRPDYVLQIVALEQHEADEGRAAVLLFDPCQQHRLDALLLESVYALTAAEVRLAESLLADHSVAQFAAAGGIKTSTVRSQLLSLFRKTRTSRQAQLIKLLMAFRKSS